MGNVAVILRVMPESTDINLEELKVAIRKAVPGVKEIREEPIGFGLKALKLVAVVTDQAGESDAIEQTISSVKGVERAEIVELTLT